MKAFEKIRRVRTIIQKEFPFFAYLSLYCKFGEEETQGVETIGIDGDGNMYYNEEWISNLTEEQLKGVLIHETLHLAFLHMVRKGTRNPELWNIAGDLAINSIIVENIEEQRSKLKYNEKINIDLPKGLVPDNEGNFQFTGLFVKNINVKGKPAEVLYDEIYKEYQDNKQNGNESRGEDEHLIRFDNHIFKSKGKNMEDLSESDKTEVEKQWINRVNEAYVYSKLRGDLPLGIELLIGKLHESKVNWKQKLIQQIQSYIPNDFTYQKCNKKSISAGVFMPDFQKERINISIAIDTSGSIQQEQLNDFISEIVGIAKAYKDRIDMRLYCHDVEVQANYKVENGSIEKIKKIKIKGGGGTSHKPIMEQIIKDDKNCKLAVFFTDGESDLNEIDFNKYKYNKLFILDKSGSDKQLKGKKMEIIKLK